MNADREEQIRSLFPLVRQIARRVARMVPGSDPDDLAGDGALGLIRAVDAYDERHGIPIEQYARRVVLGAMLNGIRRLDPVSERVRRTLRTAEADRYALAQSLGTLPPDALLEERHPGLRRARADAHRGSPLSLDAPLPPGERIALDERDDPAQVHDVRAVQRRVHAAIASLPERQRRIVVEHYFRERPLRALVDPLGVSPQRVSQLHLRAVERLRAQLATPA